VPAKIYISEIIECSNPCAGDCARRRFAGTARSMLGWLVLR